MPRVLHPSDAVDTGTEYIPNLLHKPYRPIEPQLHHSKHVALYKEDDYQHSLNRLFFKSEKKFCLYSRERRYRQ